jgi:hypothetical protein
MTEGWYGDDHLILFDEAELASASDRYAISELLPGYRVIGLRGWDDFILQDSTGRTYNVPTVPAIAEYLSPYTPRGLTLPTSLRYIVTASSGSDNRAAISTCRCKLSAQSRNNTGWTTGLRFD